MTPTPRSPAPCDAADKSGGASGAPLGDLPEWRLDDLYPGMDSKELAADLKKAKAEAAAFAKEYEGKLASLDGDGLAGAIQRYEALSQILGRVMSYASLLYHQNTTDPVRAKFLGDKQGEVTDITTPMVFFGLEMNRIEDDALTAKLAESAALTRYKPWIDHLRAFRPHQLSDELEKFLHDQSVVGAAAWNRLFDETMARLEFEVDGEILTLEATLTLLSDVKREKRAAAGAALSKVFAANLPLFARITNTHAPGFPPPVQPCGAGGRPGPARCGCRRVSEVVAPLLCAEGQMAGAGEAAILGSERPAARGSGPQDPVERGAGDGAVGLCRLRPENGGDRGAVLRQWLDRCAGEARQIGGRLRAPDRDECTPLCDAELPRQDPGRDDPGA
jgi:hypothetical protein